eukprot:1252959-Lingulodinium_polyedra.AAC.1
MSPAIDPPRLARPSLRAQLSTGAGRSHGRPSSGGTLQLSRALLCRVLGAGPGARSCGTARVPWR